jgi:hypothetical protein
MEHKEYFVAFFDVLGFEDKLSSSNLGLNWLIDKYEKLIDVVINTSIGVRLVTQVLGSDSVAAWQCREI